MSDAGANPVDADTKNGVIVDDEDITPGDLNLSGSVDLTDAVMGLKFLAGVTDSTVHKEADVNNDKKVGIEDVIYILQDISDLIN